MVFPYKYVTIVLLFLLTVKISSNNDLLNTVSYITGIVFGIKKKFEDII
jgi:hypothetical protein